MQGELRVSKEYTSHVYIVHAQMSLCTDDDGQRCTSTDPDLSFLVVTAPLSLSKKQPSSWSSRVADLLDLHTLVAELGGAPGLC